MVAQGFTPDVIIHRIVTGGTQAGLIGRVRAFSPKTRAHKHQRRRFSNSSGMWSSRLLPGCESALGLAAGSLGVEGACEWTTPCRRGLWQSSDESIVAQQMAARFEALSRSLVQAKAMAA